MKKTILKEAITNELNGRWKCHYYGVDFDIENQTITITKRGSEEVLATYTGAEFQKAIQEVLSLPNIDSNPMKAIEDWAESKVGEKPMDREICQRMWNSRLNESKLNKIITESIKKVLNEAEVKGGQYFDKELNNTHFAVNKATNKIVFGWNYSGHDSNELRAFKRDYFLNDLIDNELNPKNYTILTFTSCLKRGIDPNNQKECWAQN